ETNLWYGLIMLQTKLNALSIQDFSNQLLQLSKEAFYETLLPYKDRQTESMRKEIAGDQNLIEEYAAFFIEHQYLGGYVQALAYYSYHQLRQLFMSVVTEWEIWISKGKDWEKWMQVLTFEMKKQQSLDGKNPIQEITRITEGIHYIPEPSIWNIKLIPHVSYRPWILELRTADTKLFFYPLNEAYLLEPGVPSTALVLGHKALGDELRLKLLYQLQRGPLSLQEMSTQFHMSKTTLHHHLSLLKAAKFIKVDKGIYYANVAQLNQFSTKLTDYLGANKL
ncbi:MAG: ArsR/SmtB family transcription factor, partial [Bacillaceae bacterium]